MHVVDIIKFIATRQLTLVLPYSLEKYCKTRKIYMTQQFYTIYTCETEIARNKHTRITNRLVSNQKAQIFFLP